MKTKYKKFQKEKLTSMVIEIDITKTEKNFRQLFNFIEKLEDEKLINEELIIKDIYFK